MSMFLPEGASQSQPSGVADITPADPETTSADIALMQRVLAAASRNPNLIPQDFMAYVLDWIQTQRLQIPIGQVPGFYKNTVRIYKKATDAMTVASSAAETTVLSETIPAGTLGVTGMVRVTIANLYLNNTGGNETFTLKIKFGGTTIWGHAFTTLTGPTSYPMNLEFTIQNLGASNSNAMQGVYYSGSGAGGGSLGSVAGILGTGQTWSIESDGATAIDTSVNQDIVVTVQLGASSASLTFTRQNYMIEFL